MEVGKLLSHIDYDSYNKMRRILYAIVLYPEFKYIIVPHVNTVVPSALFVLSVEQFKQKSPDNKYRLIVILASDRNLDSRSKTSNISWNAPYKADGMISKIFISAN